eukprot:CAMPEP_0206017526 /NCGR_PEP_ID=MMETSP1464-20131121/25225_1 /ASSEMBLY_ACC=CAM_ASM_001124 /TAXON_ID=119497 /ORGANISM="Exanthemachrysis gayraliae, Strain RCC1523" /LENGTH=41 /DNA_ID= /DNA_START= /DNA_END= /DNA_ORIENTATION=
MGLVALPPPVRARRLVVPHVGAAARVGLPEARLGGDHAEAL